MLPLAAPPAQEFFGTARLTDSAAKWLANHAMLQRIGLTFVARQLRVDRAKNIPWRVAQLVSSGQRKARRQSYRSRAVQAVYLFRVALHHRSLQSLCHLPQQLRFHTRFQWEK